MNKFAVTVLTPLLLVFGATNCSAGQNPESAAKTDKAAAPAAAAAPKNDNIGDIDEIFNIFKTK